MWLQALGELMVGALTVWPLSLNADQQNKQPELLHRRGWPGAPDGPGQA